MLPHNPYNVSSTAYTKFCSVFPVQTTPLFPASCLNTPALTGNLQKTPALLTGDNPRPRRGWKETQPRLILNRDLHPYRIFSG